MYVRGQTLGELALDKTDAMCDGLEVAREQRQSLHDSLELLGTGWSAEPLGDRAPWSNDLTDDGTPFELSVVFSPRGTEVRALAEPQRAPYGTGNNWRGGLDVHDELRARGFDLSRFDTVAWLFEPAPGSAARFALWHAVAVQPDASARFKVYLNPQVRGKEHAPEITRRALQLLGLESAWQLLESKLEQSPEAEVLYFSLDLESSSSARVKVYVAHPAAHVAGLEQALLGTRDYIEGDASDWVQSLTFSSGPFRVRPMLVCYQFDGVAPLPRATLHVPVRSYNANDAEVVQRMSGWLSERQAEQLSAALPMLSGRPLHVGRGLITYVSFQRQRDGVRVAAYLAPQAYAIAAPRTSFMPSAANSYAPVANSMFRQLRPVDVSAPLSMLAVQEIIERENRALSRHPFLERVACASLPEVRVMAEGLTFWVLCFQDVLRLGAKLIKEPRLAALARTHAEEDHGHEQWFLQDVQRLGAGRDLSWVFSAEHMRVRDISYALVSEVLAARDDRARLAVLLSLDAIGGLFFGLVVRRLEQLGHDQGLRYFARSHQEVEESHDIFDGSAHAQLVSVEVSAETLVEVSAAVRRTFAALRTLADDLEGRMLSVRPLAAVG
ncbi:MAG: hypothetical protein JWN48_3316 [Myxococcaceae bacterium]|nr:hypothetical protein [Myxococcaceae bacterium]